MDFVIEFNKAAFEHEVSEKDNGEILEGSIPKSKMKLVEAWMEIHHDDLEANWKLLSHGEQFFKIEPLK